MTTPDSFDNTPNDREVQFRSVFEHLSSNRASEVWRGIDQVRFWLNNNIEDREIYDLLLDIVQRNRNIREQVRSLLIEMKGKDSKLAEETLSRLPSNVQDLLADSDDAYYAGDYKQASELYRRVLRADPENTRAREQLAKSMQEVQAAVELNPNLPREAIQYYRQARSYIAARDYLAASKLLAAAIEATEARGNSFPDAEQLLSSVQNSLIADGFKKRANISLAKNQLRDALDLYNRAVALDPSDEITKREMDSIQELIKVENKLRNKGVLKIFTPLGKLQQTLDNARFTTIADNALLKSIEKQVSQIRLTRWGGVASILIIVLVFIIFRNEILENYAIVPINTIETQTPVLVIIVSTNTVAKTIVPVVTNTITATATISPTETISPTSTLAVLGIGYIKLTAITVRESPNGAPIETLSLYQVVTILEQIDIGGSTWYRCTWDSNNNSDQGWILAEYIHLGIPPTLTP